MEESTKKKHSSFHISLMVTTLLIFILLVTLHVLAAYSPNGLFVSIGSFDLYSKYPTEITPRGFTFGIWGFIYVWQALWLFYAFFTIYRLGVEGPLYRSPILLSPSFFITYIIVLALQIAGLFIWDLEALVNSFVSVLFIMINLYIAIAISITYLRRNLEVLKKNCLASEQWWIWIGVQNGLGLYATWATILVTLHLAIMLQYESGVNQTTAGTAALASLLAYFVIWAIAQLTFLDKYCRYLLAPYVAIIWALIGIVVRNFVGLSSSQNFILAYVGLAVVSVLGIVRLVVTIVLHYTAPF